MIKELGLGVSIEIKQTKNLGKIVIMDNYIENGINRRQILNGRRL